MKLFRPAFFSPTSGVKFFLESPVNYEMQISGFKGRRWGGWLNPPLLGTSTKQIWIFPSSPSSIRVPRNHSTTNLHQLDKSQPVDCSRICRPHKAAGLTVEELGEEPLGSQGSSLMDGPSGWKVNVRSQGYIPGNGLKNVCRTAAYVSVQLLCD